LFANAQRGTQQKKGTENATTKDHHEGHEEHEVKKFKWIISGSFVSFVRLVVNRVCLLISNLESRSAEFVKPQEYQM
jgi:hypothetical protein